MIATQVRSGSLWCRKTRAKSAVISGLSAMVTSTLATVVSVMASMNDVNMIDQ